MSKTVTIPLQEYNDLVELKRRFDFKIVEAQRKFFDDLKVAVFYNSGTGQFNKMAFTPFTEFNDAVRHIGYRKNNFI